METLPVSSETDLLDLSDTTIDADDLKRRIELQEKYNKLQLELQKLMYKCEEEKMYLEEERNRFETLRQKLDSGERIHALNESGDGGCDVSIVYLKKRFNIANRLI